MATITYGAGVVGAFGPIIGAGLVQVAENLDTTVDALSKITGDLILPIGLILIITAPASVIWGRRPIFLIGNALLLASAIWSALAKDLGSLTASRVIGGMGMAPIECLAEATIAWVHVIVYWSWLDADPVTSSSFMREAYGLLFGAYVSFINLFKDIY